MATVVIPSRYEAMSSDDFETASILSEAPSYHTIPPNESCPEYSIRDLPPYTRREPPRYGLPPIPTHRPMPLPSLAAFSIPSWSTVPSPRNYNNIAQRRIAASTSRVASSPSTTRRQLTESTPVESSTTATQTENEERPMTAAEEAEAAVIRARRPLEDPYLVGEAAAAQARAQRIARDRDHQREDILVLEDRRWDWFLAHITDLENRERSWARFRQNIDNHHHHHRKRSRRHRLARLGGLFL